MLGRAFGLYAAVCGVSVCATSVFVCVYGMIMNDGMMCRFNGSPPRVSGCLPCTPERTRRSLSHWVIVFLR